MEDRESQLKEVSKMNQIMTDYQRELAIEHLGLIDQVIRKRIRVRGTPLLSYEDFYSVGCEALCDAAMRYRPEEGEFEPYAYVIWADTSASGADSSISSSVLNWKAELSLWSME